MNTSFEHIIKFILQNTIRRWVVLALQDETKKIVIRTEILGPKRGKHVYFCFFLRYVGLFFVFIFY